MKEPLDEKPIQFRTRAEHWKMWPRAGIIAVFHLKASADGRQLEIGACKFKLTRADMDKRPDLLHQITKVLETWKL